MRKNQFRIDILDEAEIDFDKSYNYYLENSTKIADTFYKRIHLSLNEIKQNPFAYPIIYKNIRKYILKNFLL